MIYLELFIRFALTGLFAIGGGLATFPFLMDMSESTGWFTLAELTDMIAISESTPGPIGINMATYAGFSATGNIFGAIIATLGLVFPSIIIILIIAKILNKFKNNIYVKNAFYGLRAASTALIAAAAYGVFKISLLNLNLFAESGNVFDIFNFKAILMGICLFFAIKKLKWHPIIFIIVSGILGILIKF